MTRTARRFNRRQILTVSALVAAALPLLAACGGTPASPTAAPAKPAEPAKPAAEPTKPAAPAATTAPAPAATTAPAPAAATTAPAAAATPTAAPAAAPKVAGTPTEIRLGTWASASLFEVMKAQVADFEQRNGTVKIKLEAAPWQQYWDKMQVQIAGGTTPDVVWMSGATFLDLNAKGAFRDLATYAKGDAGFRLPDMWNEPIFTADGKLWAVPYTASVHATFYNKTMLKEAGIPEPPTDWNAPGWTWEDLRTAAKAVTGKDKSGRDRWGVEFDNSMEWGWGTYILSNGAQVLKPDLSESTVDSPEFIAAIQFIVDMIHKDKVAPIPGDPSVALGPNIIDNFHSGRVAFRNGNNSRIPTYLTIKDFEWDICVPPRAAAGKPRKVYWVQNPYCLASASKTPEQAWQFLSYIGSKVGQDFMGTSKIIMPSLKAAAYDPQTYLKPPPTNTKLFPDAMDKGIVTDLQFTKTWLRYQQVAKEQLDPAYLGEKPVADAAKAAKREIDKVLKG